MAKKVVIGHSKRVRFNNDRLVSQALAPSDAVKALRQYKAPKFDQTVNVVVHLGIDPKAADQALRGSIAFPKGVGKSARVVCFCNADKVAAAKAAGAVEAGADELVAKIVGGLLMIEIVMATFVFAPLRLIGVLPEYPGWDSVGWMLATVGYGALAVGFFTVFYRALGGR